MATEKRLIDANALMEEINIQRRASMGSFPRQYYAVGDVLNSILNAPSVDAVEVVHARWEKCWQEKSKHYFRCSNCLTAYMDGVSGAIAPEYGSRAWRYCPNCGAKMDGNGNAIDNR